jgi:predicted TIM-barrel fold metal-dependent hydrolase
MPFIDIHAHLFGIDSDQYGNYVAPRLQRTRVFRHLYEEWRRATSQATATNADEWIRARVLEWIETSSLDKVVLLAMDAAYSESGDLRPDDTLLITNNHFVAETARQSPKALFGASIHPCRKDALNELDEAVKMGACLIKWVPSAQKIDMASRRVTPFLEAMAEYDIPLLCHTGIEHTLSRSDNHLNRPGKLRPALDLGVRTIAAHCGTSLFLHEKNYLREWLALTAQYPHLFGDISAFSMVTRIRFLRKLLRNPTSRDRILYGSDFPIPAFPFHFIPHLGWKKARLLEEVSNPLEKAYRVIREFGVPDEVFTRAGDILKISGYQP